MTNTEKVATSKRTNTRQFYMPASPEDAMIKIREKFGDEFAAQLKELL